MRSSRRLSFLGLLTATAAMGACSLINSPDEVHPGGSGGGTSSSSSSSSGSPECTKDGDCAADDACHVGKCKSGVCSQDEAPNNTPCDDGVACTVNDICSSGVCTAGPPKTCTPSNECVTSACDETSGGTCVETARADGTACTDNDPCTSNDSCGAGVCVPGPGCQDSDCTTGTCTPTGCMDVPKAQGTTCGVTDCSTGICDTQGHCLIQPINLGSPCDDGLYCTTNEICNNLGQCADGTPTCPDVNTCVLGTCDEASQSCGVMTAPAGTPCDDGKPCTDQDVCSGAVCMGQPVVSGTTCDDGNACTAGETCSGNTCSGGGAPVIIFSDTFAALNAKGWTLGSEWQIAQAVLGVLGTQCCGFTPDPGSDHTGLDGKIAGVVIGGASTGNATTAIHALSFLTSPVINTSGATGQVWLTFYRWLNSDYPPFMHNIIDVSMDGGTNWTNVWHNDDGVPIADGGWQFQQYDLTAFKSATMRFRFGFDVAQSGVYSVGSWNIDDVKIQNTPCPN